MHVTKGNCRGDAPRPLERWHLPAWPSMLAASHASWPVWSAYHHIFELTPVFPGPTHTPADLWLDWHLVEAWGLGESPILPPSGCPLLDGEEGLTKGLTAKFGQRDGASLLSFSIEPIRNGETLSTPSLPLLEARPHWCLRRGAICINITGPVGIGWRKHPQRECSCLGRGDRRTLKGNRECLCTSSLQPHLALGWCIDIGQRVYQKPLAWSWSQKVVTMPRFPSPTPSVTKIAIGMSSPLIFWPLPVMNSILAFSHIVGDAMQAKSLYEIILNQRAPKSGSSWIDIHSFSGNSCSREGSSTISSYHLAIVGCDI